MSESVPPCFKPRCVGCSYNQQCANSCFPDLSVVYNSIVVSQMGDMKKCLVK